MNNLKELQDSWEDTPEYHRFIHESFVDSVRGDETLNRHRDFIEQHAFGFGERSFHYLWLLLINEMRVNFKMLEIGVFRGQAISLIGLIAKYTGKNSFITGITPLDNTDGHWDSDYAKDIERIHDEFDVKYPNIIKALSTDDKAIDGAQQMAPYDIIYIDGGHTKEVVESDLNNYTPMVKSGGYLVIDDCNNDMNMPFGFFQGIAPVTEAKQAWLATNPPFEFICSVVHISVFRRK